VELPHIIAAIKAEPNETIRDYFMLLLLTGVRKTNGKTMRWEQINWDFAEWRIPVTKNGDPVTVPLTDQAIALLRNRQQSTVSPWVFPSATSPEKHLTSTQEPWQQIKGRATASLQAANPLGGGSLMDIRIHDLRRTFGSYQAISGASLSIIGKSLGHKSTQATQIYARLNMDAVRASVVTATDTMLALI
jgi:integrase